MSEQPKPPFPWAALTACLALLLAGALTVGGVFILAGLGWAMLAGAVPCVVLAGVILRGLTRA